MGYYTGNGVTASGGDNVRLFGSIVYNGVHNVYQKTTTTVTRKSGVSLTTAQNEKGSLSLSEKVFAWANAYPWNGCKGTGKTVNYQQINGSNLYELTITNETYKVSDGTTEWE